MNNNLLEPRAKIGDVVIVKDVIDNLFKIQQVTVVAAWHNGTQWNYSFEMDNGIMGYNAFSDEQILKNLTTNTSYINQEKAGDNGSV